jgi:hypothetical protein
LDANPLQVPPENSIHTVDNVVQKDTIYEPLDLQTEISLLDHKSVDNLFAKLQKSSNVQKEKLAALKKHKTKLEQDLDSTKKMLMEEVSMIEGQKRKLEEDWIRDSGELNAILLDNKRQAIQLTEKLFKI